MSFLTLKLSLMFTRFLYKIETILSTLKLFCLFFVPLPQFCTLNTCITKVFTLSKRLKLFKTIQFGTPAMKCHNFLQEYSQDFAKISKIHFYEVEDADSGSTEGLEEATAGAFAR